jgi:hypothetical protein
VAAWRPSSWRQIKIKLHMNDICTVVAVCHSDGFTIFVVDIHGLVPLSGCGFCSHK